MSTTEASPPLSKRSCLTCYQRKLKCDKKKPCTRCATRGEKCDYFLGPIRRNRGPRARPEATAKGVSTGLTGLKNVLAIRDGKNSNTVTLYNADPALLKETDLLVIDGTGKSRLLSAVGWASFMDEVSSTHNSILCHRLPKVDRRSTETNVVGAHRGIRRPSSGTNAHIHASLQAGGVDEWYSRMFRSTRACSQSRAYTHILGDILS